MTKPSVIALVVCDAVYADPNGKAALIGLFNAIHTGVLPVRHPRLCVYASVTDVRPGMVFRLRLVHAETESVVAELKGPPPPAIQPTTVLDFQFVLDNLVFKEPGRYYIEFWGNDYVLAQRPFEVVVRQKKAEGKP